MEKCSSESYRSTNLSSPTEIATLLNVRLTSFTVDVDGNKVPLCCSHYNHLCSILRESPRCCESCGTKPKGKIQFICHCSAPDVINAYISMLCDEQAKLSSTSSIVRLVAELGGAASEKNGRFRGPGCQCIGCTNVPTVITSTSSASGSTHDDDDLHEVVVEDLRRAGVDQEQQESEFEAESEDEEGYMNNDSETEEIMARVFGDDSENESDE